MGHLVNDDLALVAVPDALAMSGTEVVVAADAVAPGPVLLLVDDGSAEPAASPAVDDGDTPAALTPAIELVEPPDVSSVSSEDTLDELLDLLVSDLHASSVLTSEEPQADSERVAAAAEATPAGAAFGALDALDTIPRPPEPAAQGEQASPSDASLEGEADAQPPTPFVEVCAEAGPRNADVSSVSDSAEPPAPLETIAERAVGWWIA